MDNLQNYLKKHPKKEIIFDFNGTLFSLEIDWLKFRLRLWNLVSKLDSNLAKQVPNKPGMGLVLINKTIIKHGQKAREIILSFTQSLELSYLKGAKENKGLVNFIKEYSQKLDFYLWTSNFSKTIQPILEKSVLITYFKKIIAREHVNLSKPEPEGFYLIYSAKNKKSDYLLVGDDNNDQLAAKAAGIDFYKVEIRKN